MSTTTRTATPSDNSNDRRMRIYSVARLLTMMATISIATPTTCAFLVYINKPRLTTCRFWKVSSTAAEAYRVIPTAMSTPPSRMYLDSRGHAHDDIISLKRPRRWFFDNSRQDFVCRKSLQRLYSSSSSTTSSPSGSINSTNYSDKAIILEDMAGWTVQNAMSTSISILDKQGVSEARSSICHLLSMALGLSWESGYRDVATTSYSAYVLSESEAKAFGDMLKRRMNHEPIQYIVGQWDFLDYTIKIRPPLLCPRPETEELVLKVLEDPATTESPIHILDVGCGTGVIGISLADRHLNATVDAIDIDPVAVETSLENARIVLGENEQKCYNVLLCSAATYEPQHTNHKYDIVVSNPPYIPRRDMTSLSPDVVEHESDRALCGGDDGMDVIRTIISRLPDWCHRGGVCWMEVDPSHPKLIEGLLSNRLANDGDGGRSYPVVFHSSHKDMFGRDRFVKLVVR